MDTKDQFTVFLLCVLVGFSGGLLYEIFAFFRLLFGCDRGKSKALGIALDLVFGLIFAIWSVFWAYIFRFPEFRAFMCLGWGLGGIIYAKTLRRIVAFLEKVCYNVVVKLLKKAKARKKLSKNRGNET